MSGRLSAAVAEAARAREAVERSSELSGEADCPLCGQALGDAFEQVQAHRAAELAQAEERASALQAERVTRAEAADQADAHAVATAGDELKQARSCVRVWEKRRDRRARSGGGAGRRSGDSSIRPSPRARPRSWRPTSTRRRQAAEQCRRLEGRLERRRRGAA